MSSRQSGETFHECDEQKERVKACYGDWFHKLWGGNFDRASCDPEVMEFRQCVKNVMQSRKEDLGGRDEHDLDWMERVQRRGHEVKEDIKNRAYEAKERARDRAREAKEHVTDTGREAKEYMQDRSEEAKNRTKNRAEQAKQRVQEDTERAKKRWGDEDSKASLTPDDWKSTSRKKAEESSSNREAAYYTKKNKGLELSRELRDKTPVTVDGVKDRDWQNKEPLKGQDRAHDYSMGDKARQIGEKTGLYSRRSRQEEAELRSKGEEGMLTRGLDKLGEWKDKLADTLTPDDDKHHERRRDRD